MQKIVLFFAILSFVYYIYFLIFEIRESIIKRLFHLFIYEDNSFINKRKYTNEDFESFLHPVLIKRWTTFYVVRKNFMVIFCLPIIIGLQLTIATNGAREIISYTALCLYILAVVLLAIHACLKKVYRDVALSRKNIAEVKEILIRAE